RHTRFDCDWSSDVCSSDLLPIGQRSEGGALDERLEPRQLAHEAPVAAQAFTCGLETRRLVLQALEHGPHRLVAGLHERLVLVLRSEERRVGKVGCSAS